MIEKFSQKKTHFEFCIRTQQLVYCQNLGDHETLISYNNPFFKTVKTLEMFKKRLSQKEYIEEINQVSESNIKNMKINTIKRKSNAQTPKSRGASNGRVLPKRAGGPADQVEPGAVLVPRAAGEVPGRDPDPGGDREAPGHRLPQFEEGVRAAGQDLQEAGREGGEGQREEEGPALLRKVPELLLEEQQQGARGRNHDEGERHLLIHYFSVKYFFKKPL